MGFRFLLELSGARERVLFDREGDSGVWTDEHGGVKRRWRVCGRFKVVDEGGLAGVKDRAGGCASPAEPGEGSVRPLNSRPLNSVLQERVNSCPVKEFPYTGKSNEGKFR